MWSEGPVAFAPPPRRGLLSAMDKPVCVVVGVGPGNGASFARCFDAAGYRLALLSRSAETGRALAEELEGARAYACDAGQPDELVATLAAVREEMGPIDCLIYNAGSGVWGTIDEIDADELEGAWRVNALGALVAVKQVVGDMRRAGRGDVVLVGATASRRGGARFAAFSSAKGAQKNLAESMARHLWPEGIHVALLVIDGVVDTPRTRAAMPEKPDEFFLDPDDVARTALGVCRQPRSAWSFEVEVRPFGETW